jgi:hypothetical protein
MAAADAPVPLEPGRVVDWEPTGLYCRIQVDVLGGPSVDTRTMLFMQGGRVARVFPYGGAFESWRCSADTCGAFDVDSGRMTIRWDGGQVDDLTYSPEPDGIRLDDTLLRPARPLTPETLHGSWVDASTNTYTFHDDAFTFGVGGDAGLGGTYRVEGLTVVLSYADGDVIHRTLFAFGADDPPGMVSVDGEVFARPA